MDTSSPFATIPSTREGRWQLIRDVIADWFPPLSSDDGYPNPIGPVELPAALCEWYQLCGKRSDIWSAQDHFSPPSELQIQNDYLTIIVENQSCAFWGIPIAEIDNDDPPVFVDKSSDSWSLENETTTEFALQMLAYNIKWSDGTCWANGCGDHSALELVRKSYPRFPFPDWNWPVHPTQFYGTRDLIVEINGSDDYIWFWIAARTESAYREFDNLLRPTGIPMGGGEDGNLTRRSTGAVDIARGSFKLNIVPGQHTGPVNSVVRLEEMRWPDMDT